MQPAPQPADRKADLEYPFIEAPAPGAVREIAPGIFWLRMPLPFALDHINLWLLADGAGWTVVDCGYANDAARTAWEQIFGQHLAGSPVSRLIVTHCHPDHIGLCGWLAEKHGLIPWLTKSEYLLAHAAYHRIGGTELEALVALNERHGLDRARLSVISSREDHYRRGVSALPQAFRRIRHGQEISIGGNSWRVIVGHGHAPEHAALHCKKLGILISGDMLLPRISTNVSIWPMEPDGDPLDEFLTSLEHFAELDAGTLVLPSHGLPFRGLRSRIAGLNRHHQSRLDRITAVCEQPSTAAELLPHLFERKFDDYQLFFAMGETIAHLNYLMHCGAVKRVVDGGGVYRFVRRAAVTKRGTL
jgi:glyoxylase-like metal-dependent hydrolase (beta-lactamase superfamily II)